ncbi:GOLPH3/VPS74 family protein [Natronoglycomyces albus]|uniref:GPP34 family phosphoprotein n=1 Tax=Natronoglycomyces albus TaxID=2811108 RepID=A0A895XT74_9ACTN|nr:GPP34 family phosphoprotein [Natronoglycomyces albus]QSB06852.1 GPP34 family phosphoprotein [Natronoglycomyces albus]
MRLADELFFVSLNSVTGQPVIPVSIASMGMAAGLLAELVMERHITVDKKGQPIVLDSSPPSDSLAHNILDRLKAESATHTLDIWVAYLGIEAYRQVGSRMEIAGVVEHSTQRKLLKRIHVYTPRDTNFASWPSVRLRRHLQQASRVPITDAFLLGVCKHIGLEGHLLQTAPPTARTRLAAIAGSLPDELAAIVKHTEVAVGSAVLTHRT